MTFALAGSTAKAFTLPDVGAPSDMFVGPIDSNRTACGTTWRPACDACDPAGRALIPEPARQPARTATVMRDAQNQRRLNIVTSKVPKWVPCIRYRANAGPQRLAIR